MRVVLWSIHVRVLETIATQLPIETVVVVQTGSMYRHTTGTGEKVAQATSRLVHHWLGHHSALACTVYWMQ